MIRLLNSKTDKILLVLPDIAGGVFKYRPLARKLEGSCTLVGIECIDLFSEAESTYLSAGKLVEHYLSELEEFNLGEIIGILGQCINSFQAVELSKALIRKGYFAGSVFLINPLIENIISDSEKLGFAEMLGGLFDSSESDFTWNEINKFTFSEGVNYIRSKIMEFALKEEKEFSHYEMSLVLPIIRCHLNNIYAFKNYKYQLQNSKYSIFISEGFNLYTGDIENDNIVFLESHTDIQPLQGDSSEIFKEPALTTIADYIESKKESI